MQADRGAGNQSEIYRYLLWLYVFGRIDYDVADKGRAAVEKLWATIASQSRLSLIVSNPDSTISLTSLRRFIGGMKIAYFIRLNSGNRGEDEDFPIHADENETDVVDRMAGLSNSRR